MKEVPKEEFEDFINNYPRPLAKDFYMDWLSWNDFTFGKWPQSMVAMMSCYPSNYPVIYKIEKDIDGKIEERNRQILDGMKKITNHPRVSHPEIIRSGKFTRINSDGGNGEMIEITTLED